MTSKRFSHVLLQSLLTSLLALLPLASSAQATDTLHIACDSLTSRYTFRIYDHLQERGNTPICIALYCPYGQRARGARIYVSEEQVYVLKSETDTVWLLRNSLPNPCRTTTWTFVRSTSLKIYREGICLGTVPETTADQPEIWVSGEKDRLRNFGSETTLMSEALVSATEAIAPDEWAWEENISDMLDRSHDKFKNLAPDPFCNHGILTDDAKAYTTANASFTADESVRCTDLDTRFTYGLRISGEPVNDAQPLLSMPISFTAGTPYLIRFKARSCGYTARLGIGKENNYATIHDTDGQWTDFECVFTPSADRTALELTCEQASADATLDLDNWEVYACLPSTGKVLTNTAITGVQLTAGQSWSPRQEVWSYWIGFNDNGKGCSSIDTTMVKVEGLTSLTLSVEGSRLYPIAFPGTLIGMHVDGNYDMANHTREPLQPGIDYVLQRYSYPRFEFVGQEEHPDAGCYMVQFVDNLDATQVTMNFGRCTAISDGIWTEGTEQLKQDGYAFIGNPAFAPFTPEGKFLRYDAGRQLFVLTRGEEIQPFEAYIATSQTAPVSIIATGYDTRLTRVNTDDGNRIGVSASGGIITLTASSDTDVHIFSVTGRMVTCVNLQQRTPTTLCLPSGLYIIGQTKIIIP